ncbi:TPA: hypothetical protein NID02_001586 [Pseudomonas aeruginosa]|nr:hypothetical protein [Pseudomonas aeruginosa]
MNKYIIYASLCCLFSPCPAFAWTVKDFGNSGPHPELLAQSNCVGNASNNYLAPISNQNLNHTYSGFINGMAIWGDGSGGSNTSLGIGGTGIYVAGGVQYFVGPLYAHEIVQKREGGRDGGWYNVDNYYFQICYYNPVSFSYYAYDNSTRSCPADRPSGTVFIQRRYEVWTDGSARNATDWYETGNTCAAVYLRTETQSQTLPCASYAASYTEGGNGISQQRSRPVWTDGARDWSAWATVTNTCYRTVQDERNTNTASACGLGQLGKIVTKEVRTHTERAADASKTQDEKNALVEQSATSWTTVVTENTCRDVPSQTWRENGQQVRACEVEKGPSWTGSVVLYGYTEYAYSSSTKQTKSSFVETSRSEDCMMMLQDLSMDFRTEVCPAGSAGVTTFYNYYGVSGDQKIYPYGADTWDFYSTTCAPVAEQSGTPDPVQAVDQPAGLLSNLSLSSTQIQNYSAFQDYLSKLKESAFTANETHTLNLTIDDLSLGKYDSEKVSQAVILFGQTVGPGNAQIRVSLPLDAKNYVGYGGITAENVAGRSVIIQSVKFDDGMALVKYKILGHSVLNDATESSEKIILFNTDALKYSISGS